MRYLRLFTLSLFSIFCVAAGFAQTRSTQLTIEVKSVNGDNLNGQEIVLTQTDYQVGYGTLKLNAEGICSLKVYAGNHTLTINRQGFNVLTHNFEVLEGETTKTVTVTLEEKTRDPFALKAEVDHNVVDGVNTIKLSWNVEEPAFFDDFESYQDWAVNFGEWTGIDADQEAAAPLVGSYPNRGVLQYAQIINPLTVEPTWWYDYPILRPYSGQQYVGFTRTNSGNQNDDWLISPQITVGIDNVLSFMGKAADQFDERFMVYVCEVSETKTGDKQADFTRIDKNNYETADYKGWKEYVYDLSAYAGKKIKFAIRCISHFNYYGSFMLMIDDVYVGQPIVEDYGAYKSYKTYKSYKSYRLPKPYNSPANPNERFNIFLDGEKVGTTESYSYVLNNVAGGEHTVAIQSEYIQAVSEKTELKVNVPSTNFAHVTFQVTAQSLLSPNGQELSLINKATTQTYTFVVTDGKVDLGSLPYGQYMVNIAKGAFKEYQQTIDVTTDVVVPVALEDDPITPYSITAHGDPQGIFTLKWNQELGFIDSFEDYDDFATGSFGTWKTVDLDQFPVYPIALGALTNIVSFPGSGTASNPTAIAPMVFNPWNTKPAMLPTDAAIKAPTGDKTVIFFSPQGKEADKWLISQPFEIYENYEFRITAKGYTAMYPEILEFCVSTTGDLPTDFVPVSTANPLTTDQWTIYATDLSDYVGKTIRLAVHYISNDAFLAQIDDFTVGPEEGKAKVVDYGNVVRFDILLDGEKIGESQTPTYTLPALSFERHVVGIRAIYQNTESEVGEYVLDLPTGIQSEAKMVACGKDAIYDLQGRQLPEATHARKGIHIVRRSDGTIQKLCK